MRVSRNVGVLVLLAALLSGCAGKPPAVPDAAVDHAYSTINGYPEVRDSLVQIEDRDIGLVLVVPPATSTGTARQLGENFARALAAGAAIHDREFSLPSGNNLGSLYEHYNLQIVVAWSPDNVIVQGAKARGANNSIRWTQ